MDKTYLNLEPDLKSTISNYRCVNRVRFMKEPMRFRLEVVLCSTYGFFLRGVENKALINGFGYQYSVLLTVHYNTISDTILHGPHIIFCDCEEYISRYIRGRFQNYLAV